MQELPGPFGSFYSREGWPAVRFEPSRCVCVHAATILQQRGDDRLLDAVARAGLDGEFGGRLAGAGFLVGGCRWWEDKRELARLEAASCARWPGLPVSGSESDPELELELCGC